MTNDEMVKYSDALLRMSTALLDDGRLVIELGTEESNAFVNLLRERRGEKPNWHNPAETVDWESASCSPHE